MGISVLMSVYAAELPDRLDRALKSVWDDQTLKPDENILVEDGPLGPDLQAVIDSWKGRLKDSFIVLQNKENLGLTKSLNKGLDHVHHELIARMDSDDISVPDRFKFQTAYFMEHPEIDVLGGSLQEFDETNPNISIRTYPPTTELAKKGIVKANPLAHSTVMMRKQIFDNGECYDEKYRTNQDLALWFTLLSKGYRIANLSEVLVLFRRASDMLKRRGRASAVREFKIYVHGIYLLYGVVTLKYIFPLSRLVFRFLPLPLVRIIYGSNLRTKVVK